MLGVILKMVEPDFQVGEHDFEPSLPPVSQSGWRLRRAGGAIRAKSGTLPHPLEGPGDGSCCVFGCWGLVDGGGCWDRWAPSLRVESHQGPAKRSRRTPPLLGPTGPPPKRKNSAMQIESPP